MPWLLLVSVFGLSHTILDTPRVIKRSNGLVSLFHNHQDSKASLQGILSHLNSFYPLQNPTLPKL